MSRLTVREIYDRQIPGVTRRASGQVVKEIVKLRPDFYHLVMDDDTEVGVRGLFILYVDQQPASFATMPTEKVKAAGREGRKKATKAECRTAVVTPEGHRAVEQGHVWIPRWMVER